MWRGPVQTAIVPHYSGPLLTRSDALALLAARDKGLPRWTGSLDLGRTTTTAELDAQTWQWRGKGYPYPGKLKDRTLYFWDGDDFEPISRFGSSLIKLVPTDWGPPTFEIDGIKMLPSAQLSPFEDAQRKVALVEPRGKTVLDTCGGLGYFAACCLEAGVAQLQSFEKNADVLRLRTLNPGRRIRTRQQRPAACTSPMAMWRSTSPRWPMQHSMPSCTTRHASALPGSCIRRCSTTSWRACCVRAGACSITPARPTSSPAAATCPTK